MRVTPRKYAQVLATCLTDSSDQAEIIRRFLALLRRHKQFKLLPKILIAFEKEWALRSGTAKISVEYPGKFKESLTHLHDILEKKLDKKITLMSKPNDALIGGFRLRMDDTLMDASIAGALKNFTHSLT